MNKNIKVISFYLIVFIIAIAMAKIISDSSKSATTETYSLNKMVEDIKGDLVSKIEVQGSTESTVSGKAWIYFKKQDSPKQELQIVGLESFMKELYDYSKDYDFKIVTLDLQRPGVLIPLIMPLIFTVVAVVALFFVLQQMQGGGGGGNRVMNFGKNKAKMIVDDKRKTTFDNVAGLDEEKLELQELVEFLKTPKKFIDIGARIPKGVLLVGPPGTGKTLLARAVAGEAGVPFYSISGSDFVEMFVGVGASRVRDLFEQAKKNLPCIIFIDEIDAVGRKRGAGLGGGHDEREQTLNQLLVEMDGFGINEGIIIIAATNRADILDPALLRPGRFDRRVSVGIPDVKGREQILRIHAVGKIFAEDMDFKIVAQTTSGFTGADLENLLNEAALLSARGNKKEIDMAEVRKAFIKIGIGTEKKSRVIGKKERRITAYHEAGHGILFEVLSELDSVHIISVIPTGWAGGYTMPLPGEDRGYITKKYMEQSIVSLLGGRAAEFLVIKDITTGASNDIERATAIAKSMVMKYGMSEKLGLIQFGDDNDEVFIGRDLAHTRNYSEGVAAQIDDEVKRIIDESYKQAVSLLTEHMGILHASADLLMEKEKITGEEFRALFPEGIINERISEGFVDLVNGLI